MDISIEYLLNFLEDELRELPELRIRAEFPSSTRRSPDLHQNYDAKASQLHSEKGVRVYVGSRDFFFPTSWVESRQYSEIHKQAAEIRQRFLAD